jgi:ABC-type multidrug transport system fused ATPase/permease subunit
MEKIKRKSKERFGNMLFMLKNAWKYDKHNFLIYLWRIPTMVLLPVVTGLVIKVMIDAITRGVTEMQMLFIIAGLIFAIGLLTWIEPALGERAHAIAVNQTMLYRLTAFKRLMSMPYEKLESPDARRAFEMCQKFFAEWGNGAAQFIRSFVNFLMALVGGASYIALTGRINIYLILIMFAGGALQFFSLNLRIRYERKLDKLSSAEELKNEYLFRISTDFAAGKDMRLYPFVPLFERLTRKVKRAYMGITKREFRIHNLFNMLTAVLSLIVEAFAFFFLLPAVRRGEISVADFLFYFGIATGFWTWVTSLFYSLYNLKKTSDYCGYYRDFTEADEEDTGAQLPPAAVEEIRFENVSYTYAGKSSPAVKNLNMAVKKGERIAIVGENGAGKTTCMKLLSGLYAPTSGKIMINGTDASQFSRKKYFSLFSAVFQDHFILPLTIRENIALSADADLERVNKVAELSGFMEKIRDLPEGIETKLVKKLNDKAVDLSGGEKQKLLLARALYKDAQVLILDEPTAALDPIAENNIYLKYNELTQGKISFFISHRLSSTRFCDKIFYISGGEIKEAGTHEELMAQKGAYQKMFDLQSFYYREGNAFGEEANV